MTPTRIATPSEIRGNPDADCCRSDQRECADVSRASVGAERPSVGGFELEALRYRGRDGQRALRAHTRAAGAIFESAVRGDPQRQRIARDQAFDRAGCGARPVLGPPFERGIGLTDAAFAHQRERDSDRQQDRCQNEEELGPGRQPCEALRQRHDAGSAGTGLAELSEQIEEIVGNRFAQRVVIDRAQCAAEIARAWLARARSRGLLRAAGISGSLRLGSLFRTQLRFPLARVLARS